MTFYLSIYLIFYIINLISLFYITKTIFSNKITRISLPHMILYILKFSKLKNIYYALILNLTGIPPFLLFFVKVHYLIVAFSKISFIMFYIVFLVLYLNMIYYLQGLYLKDTTLDFKYIRLNKKTLSYRELYVINFFIGISYLSVFFFLDFMSTFHAFI